MGQEHLNKSIRIARNTMVLYMRMIFLMAVNIYVSRVVLSALGVDDYGIYNVVGSFVAMFSIISGSMSTAISRFITFEIGKGSTKDRLRTVFSTSVSVQLMLGIIIIILAECFGLWFINNRMNISPERLSAANWVFQLSLLTFLFNLISIPYNAVIVAYEKMSAFAYISIAEGVMKLLIAFMLLKSPVDRLVCYAILSCLLAVLVRSMYSVYCRRHFEETAYSPVLDRSLFKEMFSFAGWNFIGNGAYILNNQGVNVLSNIFFGVAVNAARGVVGQVESAINQFVNNFTVAINPQITKSYASGDKEYMYNLVCKGARLSFFMMLVFAVPVILEAETILSVWLKTVPEYAPVFLKLATVGSLCTVLSNTLVTAMFASGDIRKYQIVVGAVGLLVLPLSYVLFLLGQPPQAAYVVYIVIYAILLFIRLFLLQDMVGLPVSRYVRSVLLKILPVGFLTFAIPYLVNLFVGVSVRRVLLTIAVSSLTLAVSVWLMGLTPYEKEMVRKKMSLKFRSIKCH